MDRNDMSIQRMIIRSEVQPVVREELQPIMKQLFVVIDSLQLILTALKAMEKEINGHQPVEEVRGRASVSRKAKRNKATVSETAIGEVSKRVYGSEESQG